MSLNIYTSKYNDYINKQQDLKKEISKAIETESGIKVEAKYIEINDKNISLNILNVEKFKILFSLDKINKNLLKLGYKIK